jgi:hypothetical protein
MCRGVATAVAIASIALGTCGAAVAASGPGPGGAPPFSFVVGGGTTFFPEVDFHEHITVSAHEGPNGPTGHFTIHSNGHPFVAKVECIRVLGNRALVVGRLHKPLTQQLDGTSVTIEHAAVAIEDNGEGGLVPDGAFGTLLLPETFALGCDVLVFLTTFVPPTESGNFVVNNAAP